MKQSPSKKIGRLEFWILVELANPVIIGRLFGDPTIPQGITIQTRKVLGIDLENKYVVTEDKIYKLGEADKVWSATSDILKIKQFEI